LGTGGPFGDSSHHRVRASRLRPVWAFDDLVILAPAVVAQVFVYATFFFGGTEGASIPEGRVGHGPLHFGFDPLGEAASWDYNVKRKADSDPKPLQRSGKREREFLDSSKRWRKRERSEPPAKRTAKRRFRQYHVTSLLL
jgi:hypothetical protein